MTEIRLLRKSLYNNITHSKMVIKHMSKFKVYKLLLQTKILRQKNNRIEATAFLATRDVKAIPMSQND